MANIQAGPLGHGATWEARKTLPFAALIARLQQARMPGLVLGVRGAKPLSTNVTLN